MLAINGVLDLQVDATQNLSAIEKALRRGGNQDIEIARLPGLNHLLQTAKTGAPTEYSQIEEKDRTTVQQQIYILAANVNAYMMLSGHFDYARTAVETAGCGGRGWSTAPSRVPWRRVARKVPRQRSVAKNAGSRWRKSFRSSPTNW